MPPYLASLRNIFHNQKYCPLPNSSSMHLFSCRGVICLLTLSCVVDCWFICSHSRAVHRAHIRKYALQIIFLLHLPAPSHASATNVAPSLLWHRWFWREALQEPSPARGRTQVTGPKELVVGLQPPAQTADPGEVGPVQSAKRPQRETLGPIKDVENVRLQQVSLFRKASCLTLTTFSFT